ncbi:MAG: hypothetical protein V4772_03765 [Pseudomonadota bacterium]
MASLTTLSKTLIALVVVGAVASVVWHVGLKDRFGGDVGGNVAAGSTSQQTAPVAAPPEPAVPAAPVAVTPEPVAPAPPVVAPPSPGGNTSSSRLSPAESAEAGRKFMASGQFDQARVHLEQAVQGGDGSAACLLGEMTLKGQGGLQANQDKAAALFRLAQSKNLICFASGG